MSESGTKPAVSGRRRLSRERVLAAALEVIDAEGLEGLSMRRLGVELGVEAMSLYNHIDNKDDLLDGVVGLLWGEIAAAVDFAGAWREDVRSFALAVQEVAHRHPAAFPLTLNRGVLPAQALALTDGLVTAFRAGGFDGAVDEAVRTVFGYTAGYLLSELAWYEDPERSCAAVASLPDQGGQARAEAYRALLDCDTEAQFRVGLEVLLDGLESLGRGAQG